MQKNITAPDLLTKREKTAAIQKHWVRLTRSCNNACIFCLDHEAQNDTCIPLPDIEKDLKKGRITLCDRAVLSGGEPTIHPHFLDIVSLARNMGYGEIQTITNGRMFAYKPYLDAAVKNGLTEVTFSIHGPTESIHDLQTRVNGSFKQSIEGLTNALKTNSLIVSVDIVINRSNIKYLYRTLKFLISLGVREFDLLQVIPFGKAWINRKNVFYDIRKNYASLKKAFSLADRKDVFLWTNRFPAQHLEGFEQLIQSPIKLKDEIEGRIHMFTKFLQTGSPLDCLGKRCAYCFLENFCSDLLELKKTGSLPSKNNSCIPIQTGKNFKFDKSIDLNKFLAFYIESRYFIKGRVCKKCRDHTTCHGFPINYAKEHGFKKHPVSYDNMPYHLIRPGLSCNAKCLFCNVPPETYHTKDLTLFEVKDHIRQLALRYNNAKLSISGGEPTLRKDLSEIFCWASKNGIKTIELQTNGILLANDSYVKSLKDSGLTKVFVALHSHIPEVHDTLMGRRGCFKDCVRGVKNAIRSGLEINFNYVVTTLNYAGLPDFVEFLHRNFPKVKSLSLSVVQPRGRAWVNRSLIPRYGILDASVRIALKIAQKNKLIINNPFCGLPLCIGGWHEHLEQCVEYCDNRSRMQHGIKHNALTEDKIKPRACGPCRLFDYCNGVWKEYARLFPLDDLKPLK